MSTSIDALAHSAAASLVAESDDRPVLRRRDLLALGIPDSLQTAMVRRGLLVRLRHGVYATADVAGTSDPAERHRIDLAAAVASGREPVWAFGPSAALLHGMPLPYPVPDHLTLARASGEDERALRRRSRHRLVIPDARVVTGPVDPSMTSVVRGVAAVAPALAAVSTASELTSNRWRTALFDAALWRGATEAEIAAIIDAWRHLGHRAALIAALSRARSGAQTVLETLSRLALVEGGLPEPILQQAFYDDEGLIGFVDMWWPTLRVIGEADGLMKYRNPADLVREKRREDRLRALGPVVVRWTARDIETDPGRVVAAIRRAGRIAA